MEIEIPGRRKKFDLKETPPPSNGPPLSGLKYYHHNISNPYRRAKPLRKRPATQKVKTKQLLLSVNREDIQNLCLCCSNEST